MADPHEAQCLPRTHTHDIELKATFQQLLLDLIRDAVEADVAFGEDRLRLLRVHRGRHCAGLFGGNGRNESMD